MNNKLHLQHNTLKIQFDENKNLIKLIYLNLKHPLTYNTLTSCYSNGIEIIKSMNDLNFDEIIHKNLKNMTIVGHNVWQNQTHWLFLEKAIANQYIKNTTLTYQTVNPTSWKSNWVDIWNCFDQTFFYCHVSTCSDLNKNVRYCGNWERVNKITNEIKQLLIHKPLKFQYAFVFYLHQLNAYHVKSFVSWRNHWHTKAKIHINFVKSPAFLSILLWDHIELQNWNFYLKNICDDDVKQQLTNIQEHVSLKIINNQNMEFKKFQWQKLEKFINWWKTPQTTHTPRKKSILTARPTAISLVGCPHLTNGIATTPTGSLRACGASLNPHNKLLNKDQQPFKIWDDWHQAINSENIKQWRKQFKNNIWPSICKKCEMSEKSRGWSKRIKSLKILENLNINPTPINDDGSVTDTRFIFLDLRLGNLCNLQCQMCNGFSSSRWQKYHDERFQHGSAPKHAFWQWPLENQNWVKEFLKNSEHIRELYFTGGEPLINQSHWQLLEQLSKTPCAKHIRIKYNTNATVWDDNWEKIWLNFNHVLFQVSVDGVGHVNDWIRWPSKWEKITYWIEKLHHLHEKNQAKIQWRIAFTLQRSNAWYLDEFQSWCNNYPKQKKHLEFLVHPSHLSLQAWNENQKNEWLKWAFSWANSEFLPYIKEAEAYFKAIPALNSTELEEKFQLYMQWWQSHTGLPMPNKIQ